jgi:sphingomyelin phosphodiesterase acid-like 3
MKEMAPQAQFATLTGDLLVHSLRCRFDLLVPGKTDAEYREFVEKTAVYVLDQVKLTLGVPVYVALGNNDAWCKDYGMDPGNSFLKATEPAVLSVVPVDGADRKADVASFEDIGDYSVLMAKPMEKTRLIVMDDLFQSARYTDCAGKPNPAPGEVQIAWLEKELAAAKRRGERVWVMAHIPPGIDSYKTVTGGKNVCKGDQPVMLLSNEKMMDLMSKYSDIIKLGLFAHMHMDEMRLYGGEGAGDGPKGRVAIKIVPPITPLASNVPSFTVAKVNPATAQLVDYTVYAASNPTGVNENWKKTYSYGETYQQMVYSPEALSELMEKFEGDPEAQGSASGAYLRRVIAGEKGLLLRGFWPEYTCMMQNNTAKSFAACFCPEK